MLATSTHDSKRGEDVRARLALLSEIPDQWAAAVRRWSEIAGRHRTAEGPDRNAEYLFYQTLVGAWPLETDRAVAYMEKATHEAKVHTSWTAPNAEYDSAVRRFVEGILADEEFTALVRAFVEPLVRPGWINGLSQVLLKLTAPGVPDIYQGAELWSLHLVDPDNRRPVDYEVRRRALREVQALCAEQIWRRADEGLPKLWTIHKALALRARRSELFGAASSYDPIPACGERASHVLAFGRGGGSVTVVPRLVLGLAGDWRDTTITLPPGAWHNVLTGDDAAGRIRVADLLSRFPVALLERRDAEFESG
jgi:(1->4)-alpha-D-glucan 1-alpha-D-glucosylmutase